MGCCATTLILTSDSIALYFFDFNFIIFIHVHLRRLTIDYNAILQIYPISTDIFAILQPWGYELAHTGKTKENYKLTAFGGTFLDKINWVNKIWFGNPSAGSG